LPVVSNTSPLIWLSKIGRINLLRELYGEVVIPEEVYMEAVQRGLEDFSDALVIQEGIDQGWIKVSNLNEEEAEISRRMAERAFEIHLGEAQAIQLARKINAVILMDESSGRVLAEAWGLRVRGTLAVILRALGEGLIDNENAKEHVLKLVNKGFRIEPRLLARILKEIDGTAPRHRG